MRPETLASTVRDAAARVPGRRGTSTAPVRAGQVASTAPAPGDRPARPRLVDALIGTAYLLASFALYRDLWFNLPDGYLTDSGRDQNLFEWFFAVQAHALAGGHPVLYSDLQNHPIGVNLMGNTAMPGLALPLAPITWAFGPTVTWATVLTFGLAATAAAWYWLFSRYLARSPWAAGIGGAFCAFTPPVISHAHAHPNFTATFLLPVIVARLYLLSGLRGPRRWRRDGPLLGALLAWQVLIGEEPLLILATGLAVFVLAWAVTRPARLLGCLRAALPGLAVALGTTLLLVGCPLWVQFAGPASYHALPHGPAGNDLAALGALPRQSIGGQLLHPGQVVANPTEQNSYFGLPLLVLLAVTMAWLSRHDRLARVFTITLLGTLGLSLGNPLFWATHDTGIPGPWWLLHRLPLYGSLIEARLTFACLPVIGALLAMATDRALARPSGGVARRAWFAALVLAVLPILPVRFAVHDRPATPAFFASGTWRQFVEPGRAIVPVPLPSAHDARALHWQVAAGIGFPIAEGYFVGPAGPAEVGVYGAVRRPTSALLGTVAKTGRIPPIGPAQRAQATADLRFWQADAVVLAGANPHQEALRATLDALFGPGTSRGGVDVWDVRRPTG
jgi:hypothetical protein